MDSSVKLNQEEGCRDIIIVYIDRYVCSFSRKYCRFE